MASAVHLTISLALINTTFCKAITPPCCNARAFSASVFPCRLPMLSGIWASRMVRVGTPHVGGLRTTREVNPTVLGTLIRNSQS